jgi:hypothetical protein
MVERSTNALRGTASPEGFYAKLTAGLLVSRENQSRHAGNFTWK